MSFLKNIFKKFLKKPNIVPEEKGSIETDLDYIEGYDFSTLCAQCMFRQNCSKNSHFCEKWHKEWDKSKRTFLIIDDNFGIVAIIKDIIDELNEEGKIDLKEWNILSFQEKQAGIQLIKALKIDKLKVDAAFIDMTYGSIIRIKDKNIKINGIHIFKFLKDINKNLKFKFYTGNILNDYISNNKEIIDYFKKITGEDIENYMILKSGTTDEDLKEEVLNLFRKVDK